MTLSLAVWLFSFSGMARSSRTILHQASQSSFLVDISLSNVSLPVLLAMLWIMRAAFQHSSHCAIPLPVDLDQPDQVFGIAGPQLNLQLTRVRVGGGTKLANVLSSPDCDEKSPACELCETRLCCELTTAPPKPAAAECAAAAGKS